MVDIFNSIPVAVTFQQVLAQLYPPDHCMHSGQRGTIRQHAEWAVQAVQDCSNPKGVLAYLEPSDLQAWPYLAEHRQAVAGIVTLGHGVDRELERLSRIDPVKAVFLDAAASVAVESACDYLDDAAGRWIAERNLARAPRISPGYGDFPLSDQQYLFERVPAHRIDVTLTSGFMMHPLKSISFIVLAGQNPANLRQAFTCDMCGLINCPLRKTGQRCSNREVFTS